MLELSFKVISSEVFDRLDQECFLCDKDDVKKVHFDEKKSILHLKGRKIKISEKDKITNSHKIIKYIFLDNKDNLEDDYYYSEIASDEFEDLEYKKTDRAWQKYYTACEKINKKLLEDGIKDFLIFNTGKQGRVKINRAYI